MKKNILKFMVTFICLIITFCSTIIAQTGKIPWIPLSKDAPDEIPGRNGPAPTYEEIGIMFYPGAYLSSVYPASKTDESDTLALPLPGIFLVTSDEVAKVKEYYKKHLKKADGWKSFEDYSTFSKGNLSEALSRTVPGVAIREETGESFDLTGADPKIKSSLKTRIKILYKP
jgi:hypothetical protein